MGQEIDLLKRYPKTKRNLEERFGEKKDPEVVKVARQFGKTFFDGDRKYGYGGYNYHPRFWTDVVQDLKDHYQLTSESKVLDVGCGKGFLMHDIARLIPGITVKGIDISEYAIENAMDDMKAHVQVANATSLPFEDNSFDLVISLNTLHNLEGEDLVKGFKEVQRVSRGHAFVVNDAYETDAEKEALNLWNLTARSILHVKEWEKFFDDVGYTGDYYWFKA